MWQCVAVCCSMFQYVVVSSLQNTLYTITVHLTTHKFYPAFQCVAMCCSVLQCVAVRCTVMICSAFHWNEMHYVRWLDITTHKFYPAFQCVAVCCSVLQCVALCCTVLQSAMKYTIYHDCSPDYLQILPCDSVCFSVLQCIAVCCSVLQCVAVSSLQNTLFTMTVHLTKFKFYPPSCCSMLQCDAVCCSQSAMKYTKYHDCTSDYIQILSTICWKLKSRNFAKN